MVIKASGVDFEAMTPETVVVCDLFGRLVEGELVAFQRCCHARLRLPAHARDRRRGTHAQRVRDGVRRPGRADPVRADRHRRRVRWRDSDRAVRPDRRRRDRPRDRRDARRAPLTGGADAEPRRVHAGLEPTRRAQGGGHVRGRRPHRASRARPRRAVAARPPRTSTRCTTATRTSTANAEFVTSRRPRTTSHTARADADRVLV